MGECANAARLAVELAGDCIRMGECANVARLAVELAGDCIRMGECANVARLAVELAGDCIRMGECANVTRFAAKLPRDGGIRAGRCADTGHDFVAPYDRRSVRIEGWANVASCRRARLSRTIKTCYALGV